MCPCAFFQRVLQSVLSGKTDLHYHALVEIAIRVLDATLAKIDEAGEKLQNIGSSVENVGKKFLPVTAAASSNANTNVSMMGETFKYCAPIASALGFSAEDP